MKEFIVPSIDALPQAAENLLMSADSNKRVFLFDAPMGAGKTTLIKSICASLGVKENVSSPTFSIVNEYQGSEGPVYHFDFYRLKNEQEAYDLGYEEYFYSGHYCMVEWPKKIPTLLPDDAAFIEIEITGLQSRIIRLMK